MSEAKEKKKQDQDQHHRCVDDDDDDVEKREHSKKSEQEHKAGKVDWRRFMEEHGEKLDAHGNIQYMNKDGTVTPMVVDERCEQCHCSLKDKRGTRQCAKPGCERKFCADCCAKDTEMKLLMTFILDDLDISGLDVDLIENHQDDAPWMPENVEDEEDDVCAACYDRLVEDWNAFAKEYAGDSDDGDDAGAEEDE